MKSQEARTFVPFILKVNNAPAAPAALYIRVVNPAAQPDPKAKKVEYPWDDIHFIPAEKVAPILHRVFMAPAGTYDVYVAYKERTPEKNAPRNFVPKMGVLKTQVTVPDYYNGERNSAGRPDVFHGWGLGNQHFHDVSGPAQGDRLVEGGGFTGNGHHGDAYGLTSVFAFDAKSRNGVVVLVGGTGFDPATTPGAWSWAPRYEERIVTALWRRAIQGRRD